MLDYYGRYVEFEILSVIDVEMGDVYEYAAGCSTGVAGVLLAVQFKGGKTEYSTYIALGVSVLIFTAVLGQLEVLVDTCA